MQRSKLIYTKLRGYCLMGNIEVYVYVTPTDGSFVEAEARPVINAEIKNLVDKAMNPKQSIITRIKNVFKRK